MLNPNSIIRTEIIQRKGDKKFALWALMPDPTFNPKEYSKNTPLAINPIRWVTIGVFETMSDASSKQQSLLKQKQVKQQEKREKA